MVIVDNSKKWIIIFFLFLSLFFATFYIQRDIPKDYRTYEKAIIENDIQPFRAPILFYLGKFSYMMLGSNFAWIIPLLCFAGFFIYMAKLFNFFKISPAELILFLFVDVGWTEAIFDFSKDAVLLFIASAFFYYLFKFNYSNKKIYLLPSLIFSVLAVWVKYIGLTLFLLLLLYLIFRCLKAFPVTFFFFDRATDVNEKLKFYNSFNLLDILKVKDYMMPTSISIFAYMANPLFFMFTFIVYYLRKHKLLLLCFGIMILLASFIFNFGFDSTHIYRYTFFFFPAIACAFGIVFKDMNRYKAIIKLVLVFLAMHGAFTLGLYILSNSI